MSEALVRSAHDAAAWVMVLANAAVGGWALAAHRWPRLRHRSLWWATTGAEVTVAVQVALGLVLQRGAGIEPPPLHPLYGFAAIMAIGVMYSYRSSMRHRLCLLYGFGGLFIMGLGIRAMFLT